MRSWKQPLIRLNIQEENQIEDIHPNRVNLVRGSIDERVGIGVENGSKGIKDEACMVNGDLE